MSQAGQHETMVQEPAEATPGDGTVQKMVDEYMRRRYMENISMAREDYPLDELWEQQKTAMDWTTDNLNNLVAGWRDRWIAESASNIEMYTKGL